MREGRKEGIEGDERGAGKGYVEWGARVQRTRMKGKETEKGEEIERKEKKRKKKKRSEQILSSKRKERMEDEAKKDKREMVECKEKIRNG
jgi:hypothetical protein